MTATVSPGTRMLPNVVKALIERLIPWYDPIEAQRRSNRTELTRKRSIAARIAAEDIARRYERYDNAVRR